MEEVGAVELLVVGLVHGEHVLISLEYFNLENNVRINLSFQSCYKSPDLVRDLWAAPDKVPLPGDGDLGPDVAIHGDRLVTVRVPEYDVGDPQHPDL